MSVLNYLWRYRSWLLAGLPPLIVYCLFIKQYVYLGHHNTDARLINYCLLELIPVGAILVSMLFFKFKLDRGLSVISSMLINAYAVYTILPYWCTYYWNLLISKGTDIVSIYKQWARICGMSGFWFYAIDWFQIALIASAWWMLWRDRQALAVSLNLDFNKRNELTSNFGTAKFLDQKRIKKIIDNYGIVVGAIPGNTNFNNIDKMIHSIKKQGGKLIKIKADHAILIAPSGAGKNVGVIMPTLLDYPGPVFVNDIKGENYEVTKRAREAMGQKVIAFDPFGITSAPRVRINPLSFLDPNSKNIVDDIQTLADLICPNDEKEGSASAHFQGNAASLIKCIALHVVAKLPDEEKNLYSVYQMISNASQEGLLKLLKEIAEDETVAYGEAANLANAFFETAPEERSGIFNTARNHLRFLGSPYVKEATSVSDVDLAEIIQGHIDLFICIPPEKLDDQKRLVRLFIGVGFIEMLRARGNTGKHKLLMLIDEMPALGFLKQIDKIRTYGRGFGISLLAVSQTIQDLKDAYPSTWQAFFSSQLSIFFGSAEPGTSEFICKKLGKKTIEVSSNNQSEGTQKRETLGSSNSASQQKGSSISETGRELLTPDEIERLGDRVVIAFKRGEYPIICHRIDYRERKEWKNQWDDNPLHKKR